jgi:hypothetical protein
VALESTLISHGLPTASAAATAREVEQEVRRAGAVPATIAVLDGEVRIGLDDEGLVRVAEDPAVVKASTRDLPVLLARRASGATTVAATSYLAHLAGIRVPPPRRRRGSPSAEPRRGSWCAGPGAPHGAWPLAAAICGTRGCRGPARPPLYNPDKAPGGVPR